MPKKYRVHGPRSVECETREDANNELERLRAEYPEDTPISIQVWDEDGYSFPMWVDESCGGGAHDRDPECECMECQQMEAEGQISFPLPGE